MKEGRIHVAGFSERAEAEEPTWFRDRRDEAGFPIAALPGSARRSCGVWRRLVARKISSPASAAKDMREIRVCVEAANKSRMATEGMAQTHARFPETGKRL